MDYSDERIIMEPADEYDYKGHTITIGYEEHLDGMSPRDWDNLGVMACAHRNYDLGDEQVDPESMTITCAVCGDAGSDTCGLGLVPVPIVGEVGTGYADHWTHPNGRTGWIECPACDGAGEVVDPVRWAVEREGATVVLGLYLYDHSGITMSASTLYRDGAQQDGGNPFSCQWDSGMVGIMYDTPETRKTCGTPLDRIEECLHGEVKTYDDFLTGDVFYLRVTGPNVDEAVGGYYLSHDGPYSERFQFMRDEAESWIDGGIEREQQEVKRIARIMAL